MKNVWTANEQGKLSKYQPNGKSLCSQTDENVKIKQIMIQMTSVKLTEKCRKQKKTISIKRRIEKILKIIQCSSS